MKIVLIALAMSLLIISPALPKNIEGTYEYVELPGRYEGKLEIDDYEKTASVKLFVSDLINSRTCEITGVWPTVFVNSVKRISGELEDIKFEIIFKEDEAFFLFTEGNAAGYCGLNVDVQGRYRKLSQEPVFSDSSELESLQTNVRSIELNVENNEERLIYETDSGIFWHYYFKEFSPDISYFLDNFDREEVKITSFDKYICTIESKTTGRLHVDINACEFKKRLANNQIARADGTTEIDPTTVYPIKMINFIEHVKDAHGSRLLYHTNYGIFYHYYIPGVHGNILEFRDSFMNSDVFAFMLNDYLCMLLSVQKEIAWKDWSVCRLIEQEFDIKQ